MIGSVPGLRPLARRYGIQTSYFNVEAERVRASDDTLLYLLRTLGAAVYTSADVEQARREAAFSAMRTPIEPVLVAWEGRLPAVEVRAPARPRDTPRLHLVLEDGSTPTQALFHLSSERETDVEGVRFAVREYCSEQALPQGYHTLAWEASSARGTSLIISAPDRCYTGGDSHPEWGLFAPLYAVRSARDWGAGTYSDLLQLAAFVDRQGGSLVGTLPILPCFYEKGMEPSPYLPVTRLLWSEFFIDIEAVEFLSACTEALELLSSRAFLADRARLTRATLVNYPDVLRLKRQALESLSRLIEHEHPSVESDMQQFLRKHPLVRDYAAFRATIEATGRKWQDWSGDMRGGNLGEAPGDPAVRRYYEFTQWLAHRQLERITDSDDTADLYLDLPIGVHPEGYDAWRHQERHLTGVSCGAPPDVVFTTGQNWRAPPMHPTAMRQHGYEYWRLCLQHHMRHCDVLRVDHVMGLHRMYCIPHGHSAAHGAYVRYRQNEMYAVLCLESHRNHTAVVGEDLGTVPHAVRDTMNRHALNRMFVLYYEMPGMADGRGLRVPRNSLACISTHDMPPFAAIWRNLDIRQQAKLGILAPERLPSARSDRRKLKHRLLDWLALHAPLKPANDEQSVLRSILSWLGVSRARYVIANIEDFWLETGQPNVPGAGGRYPSWTQRMSLSLEQILADSQTSEMAGILEKERAHRREARKGAEE